MDIPMGGFDLTADIIAGIEDGTITATVDQPYSQGFYAITQLVALPEVSPVSVGHEHGRPGSGGRVNVASVKELTGTIR